MHGRATTVASRSEKGGATALDASLVSTRGIRPALGRLAGAAVVAATALGAVPLGAALAQSTPAAAVAPLARCATAQLVVWLNTQGNGAAGSVYYDLQFTNLGQRACTLSGFPGISALSLSRQQLGSPAAWDHTHPARPVTIKPGSSATAVLRIVDVYNYPNALCRRQQSRGIRVYPPGERQSAFVPFPFAACARPGPRYLSVGAIQASANG